MTPRRALLPALAAAALLTATACDILDPGWSRRLGLVMAGIPPMTSLVAPDAVTHGIPFQITASTFGSSSCTRADGYEVTATAGAYEVRLFDQSAPPNTACTEDLRSFPRTLTVQFDQAGSAEIRVIGRGDGPDGMAPRTIRKSIIVQ